MKQRRRVATRDQGATPFSAMLLRLCDSTGALGAALVDYQGETVDYAGSLDPYEIKVAAAEWRLVLAVLAGSRVFAWADTVEVLVRARHRSFGVIRLPEGYAIVLQLGLRCFSMSQRAVSEAVREICSEAGLELPGALKRVEHWSRVEVKSAPDDPRRPTEIWVGSAWARIELLGRYEITLLDRGEIGFRARLANGAEINLVREALGRWYAEDLPER